MHIFFLFRVNKYLQHLHPSFGHRHPSLLLMMSKLESRCITPLLVPPLSNACNPRALKKFTCDVVFGETHHSAAPPLPFPTSGGPLDCLAQFETKHPSQHLHLAGYFKIHFHNDVHQHPSHRHICTPPSYWFASTSFQEYHVIHMHNQLKTLPQRPHARTFFDEKSSCTQRVTHP